MIRVSGLNKSFGARRLFQDAELSVFARDRMALVGPNGSGKTTLFEMIAGLQRPDSGRVEVPKGIVVGYLKQETDELRGKTLLDEVLSAGSATTIGHRLEVLRDEMTSTPPGPEHDRLVREFAASEQTFASLGGYDLEFEAKRILGGLGFKTEDLERQTETFSGGWLMRIALAKLLVSGPDLLMLDEPTNHLDLESVEWLERFLKSYQGAVLLISHDRDLINGFATKVTEIANSKLITYAGDFESFIAQRELAAAQAEAEAKNQARKIAQTQLFIDRFRYKASKAKQVQSRIKSLERMDRVESPRRRARTMSLAFPQPKRPGRVVLEIEDVSFSYPGKQVYRDLNLAIERDHKIALVGPNGAGKSTLLKLIAGVLVPESGQVRLGHNASLGYFAQHQIEALDPTNRVIEEMQTAIAPGHQVRPRDLLGRMLFSGDDADKPVAVLSGGERTRLALGKMLASAHNLLCLDEPTNHLDMESRDVLEEALLDYEGSLVLITHDRHLIRSVANRIVEVVEGRITVYEGDYEHYVDKRDGVAVPVKQQTAAAPKQDAKHEAKQRRREQAEDRRGIAMLSRKMAKLEREIEALTAEVGEISQRLADPEFYTSGADVPEMVKLYEVKAQKVAELESRWESIALQLEDRKQSSGVNASI